MYRLLKAILTRIMPDSWLRYSEPVLRNIFSWFLKGNRVICNLCGREFIRFIPLPSGDLLCPGCGSLPRQRRLWEIIREILLARPGIRILHISPSRRLSERIRQLAGRSYVTSAVDSREKADRHFDITSIASDDGGFDLIICYHILEHIKEDRKAMRELYRISAPCGMLLVQSPFRQGSTYEDHGICSPGERKRHFGQEDHLRIYERDDLCRRLEEAGWKVRAQVYGEDERLGLREGETVIFCTK